MSDLLKPSHIEHTLLTPVASKAELARHCQEALDHGFHGVCVAPCNISFAREYLGQRAAVVSVVGFPLGNTLIDIKSKEANMCVHLGASELDIVVNIGRLIEGDFEYVSTELRHIMKNHLLGVSESHPKITTKLIIETCLLAEPQKRMVCDIAKHAGVDFIKTSTGLSTGGATPEDVRIIRDHLGPHRGIKASGGIKTRAQAEQLIEAGADRIGTSCGPELFK